MAVNLPEEYTQQVNSIFTSLPAVPFVIDMIGRAMEICYTEQSKEDFEERMKLLPALIEYTNKTSRPNYFKYRIPISILLAGIAPEKWTVLDTADGTVTATVGRLTDFLNAPGWKKKWVALFDAAQESIDNLFIILTVMMSYAEAASLRLKKDHNLTDLNLLLGLGYLEVCLRKTSINISNDVFPLYNKFMAFMLNKVDY